MTKMAAMPIYGENLSVTRKTKIIKSRKILNKTPASSYANTSLNFFSRMQFYAVGCDLIYVDDGKNKISKMSLNQNFHLIKMTYHASNNFDD